MSTTFISAYWVYCQNNGGNVYNVQTTYTFFFSWWSLRWGQRITFRSKGSRIEMGPSYQAQLWRLNFQIQSPSCCKRIHPNSWSRLRLYICTSRLMGINPFCPCSCCWPGHGLASSWHQDHLSYIRKKSGCDIAQYSFDSYSSTFATPPLYTP